jgi:hypothetical protein
MGELWARSSVILTDNVTCCFSIYTCILLRTFHVYFLRFAIGTLYAPLLYMHKYRSITLPLHEALFVVVLLFFNAILFIVRAVLLILFVFLERNHPSDILRIKVLTFLRLVSVIADILFCIDGRSNLALRNARICWLLVGHEKMKRF